jgi:hypothetical protein
MEDERSQGRRKERSTPAPQTQEATMIANNTSKQIETRIAADKWEKALARR